MKNLDDTSIHGELSATNEWAKKLGRCPVTIWHWVHKVWLTPINISGRSYLRREDIDRFLRRAASGEFSHAPRGAAAQLVVGPRQPGGLTRAEPSTRAPIGKADLGGNPRWEGAVGVLRLVERRWCMRHPGSRRVLFQLPTVKAALLRHQTGGRL